MRSEKTFQFPAFRAQSQLCGSNTLKVIAIWRQEPYSPVQPLISNHIMLQHLVVCIFEKHWLPQTTKNCVRYGKPLKFPAFWAQPQLCSSNTLEVRGILTNKLQLVFIKLQVHFPNLIFVCCLQTALTSKVLELQSRDCAQNVGICKGFLDLRWVLLIAFVKVMKNNVKWSCDFIEPSGIVNIHKEN